MGGVLIGVLVLAWLAYGLYSNQQQKHNERCASLARAADFAQGGMQAQGAPPSAVGAYFAARSDYQRECSGWKAPAGYSTLADPAGASSSGASQ